MRILWIVFLVSIPLLGFSQQITVRGTVPYQNSGGTYRLQVGAYRGTYQTQTVFNQLRTGGLSPYIEEYGDIHRVVLPGLNAQDVPVYIERLRVIGLREVWIRVETPAAVPSVQSYQSVQPVQSYQTVQPMVQQVQQVPVQQAQPSEPIKGQTTTYITTSIDSEEVEDDPDAENYPFRHNITIDVKEQGTLKIRSRTDNEGLSTLNFSFIDAQTGEESVYTADSSKTPDGSPKEITWVIEPKTTGVK
ncbi:MAG: hypothetical protein LBG76_09980 [Treponema sp.]|jgi:hypothetical protein|nr:hypothetical protein [Treponema sp.]